MLAGVVVVSIVAPEVLLAVFGVPKPISGGGDVFANLGRNLITAFVLGLVAYLWFYFWTSERATHQLRDYARRWPERLFPTPPRISSAEWVVGRDALVEDIVTNLKADYRTGPQVIVGETGSGKTSFLLRLAAHLARELDVLPIVLTLRDLTEIDFAKLAKERFAEYIDPRIRSDADAEKLWRWMSRRGRIVVLADDLDRAKLDEEGVDLYKNAARGALAAARRRDLPLVVASRPEGVPANLDEPPIELPRLELSADEALEHVLDRAGRSKRDEGATQVADNIAAGRLVDNAFYLGLLAELVRTRNLHPPPRGGEHAVRLALLKAWRASLLGDRTVGSEDKAEREAALEGLEGFAAERLSPAREDEPETDWLGALNAGLRFRLVHVDEEGRYRFTHDVVHAYFASRALAHDQDGWEDALQETPDAPRVQLALLLTAADTLSAGFCGSVCQTLLAASADTPAEQRLLRAAAAAETARAGAFSALDSMIAHKCIEARRGASPLAKRAALEQLGLLTGERAVEALWDYAEDDDYQVRWAAADQLVRRCSKVAPKQSGILVGSEAYRVLTRRIEKSLAQASPFLDEPLNERPDDWTPEIAPLKQIAWMLPALRTSAAQSGDPALADAVTAHLQKLLQLEEGGVTPQRGLEASLAQGFKVDARLHPHELVDADALRMLDHAVFWYSQLNLLQALAVRVAHRGDSGQAGQRIRELAKGSSPKGSCHPFVKAAAKLCLEAIDCASKGPDSAERYVWDDEGVVVSRRPADLAPEAIQLVGDITVLLNLNETGDFDQREKFGKRYDIPYCLEKSETRAELFERCAESCTFRLCPFRPVLERLSAHREISRAFCRHQRVHASKRTARTWGSHVQKRALREFWARLESLARI